MRARWRHQGCELGSEKPPTLPAPPCSPSASGRIVCSVATLRPVAMPIQQQLENPLARQILEGPFVSGDSIAVEAEGGHLVFAKA